MNKILDKLYNYLLFISKNVSLKQANIVTTVVILSFTIIFAYLLIQENNYDYERALLKEQQVKHLTKTEYEDTRAQLKAILIKNTIAIATLAFILFIIVLGLYNVLNAIIKRDIQEFLDFFKEAAHNEKLMDQEEIFFRDFKYMVGYANNMVETISAQKRSLKELNANLEDKVEEKTRDLVETNKKLLEEKQFSEDILRSQKEFLRYTVHETNTPLSVILASIELFVMKHGRDKQLSKIEAATKNIFNIYDDLSYLVKKDQVEYPKVAIDIESYVSSRVDFFSEVAQLNKVSFSYKSQKKQLYVYFNETKLQRVIDNTITNAIKYTLANEVIDVEVLEQDHYVTFSVGSVSREIKDSDKIFDAYYKENENSDGFGLGLRLVRSICDEEDVGISLKTENGKNIFSYKFVLMGE